ncbi:hypothetical protein AB0M38_21815 [Streptomyces sp. NPDC051742]|uniref:hypothetical protein n=1 Tax=unclassified Streptomyces TaxID=2593676 RepID=UPI003447F735
MMRDLYEPDVDHAFPEALLHVLREGHALPEALRRTVFHPPLQLAGCDDERPGETHIVRGID